MRHIPLFVALGNPGYDFTPHNLASDLCTIILRSHVAHEVVEISKNLFLISNGDRKFLLFLKPSLMNISGKRVGEVCKRLKPSKVIVIVDDLDTKWGILKYKESSSASGHNGVRSIITSMPLLKFSRILCGVGRPSGNLSVADFVLTKYPQDLKNSLDDLSKELWKIILEHI